MNLLFIFISLFFSFQDYTLAFELEEEVNFIYRDNLDNLYLVDDYTIKKFDTKGNLMFSYSDNYLGKISSVSIGEGLKVYVYYNNNAQLVLLDNTLSNLSPPLTLNFYNLGTSSLQCSSIQNRYWFYDPLQGAIIRTTNTFSEVFNSGNLDQLLGLDLEVNFMTEWGNNLYLVDEKNGVFVFDIFGTYKKTIPIYGLKSIQVSEKGLFYIEEKKLKYYDFESFLFQEISTPLTTIDNALISSKMLYIEQANRIIAFKRNTY